MEEQNVNVSTEQAEAVETEKKEEVSAKEQELLLKIAMLEKKADKMASDASSWKKKYNDTLDKNQQMELAKSEEDAKFKEKYAEMERKIEISDNRSAFLNSNIPNEYLDDLSVAFYEGDKATFFDVLGKAIGSIKKNEKATALQNMPTAPISSDSNVSMTKEQYDKLSYMEQLEFKNKNPELWAKMF